MKYFKTIIGTDIVKNKPHKESYTKACLPYNLDECVMIGDDLYLDIECAKNKGLNTILVNTKNYDVKDIGIGIPKSITSTVTSLKMDVYNQLIDYLR